MLQFAAAPKWAVSLCDRLETMIFTSELNARAQTMADHHFWNNNYKPVPEMAPTTNLRVTGSIPECLNGEFMRVGPNPRYLPLGGYHWFDGDGMIHGLKMKNGRATYVARYVQTTRLLQEERYGAPKFLKVGDLKGMRGFYCVALEVLRKMLGVLQSGFEGAIFEGNANTALVYHNNKILALQEGDKPYVIKVMEDGDLETVGLEDFKQQLEHSFAAHPKIDPITGEMFSVACGQPAMLRAPRFIYRVVSKEGLLGVPVPITMPHACLMHDFAITENYAIFMDLPLGLNLLGMAKGEFALKFDPSKKSRLGVMPRYATSDSKIRWFTIPTCYIFHTLCAWEQGDEVVLTCCRMDDVNLEFFNKALEAKLYEYRLNLVTGDVKHRQLCNLPVEFPRINTDYTGRKVRYAYCTTVGDEKSDDFTGVVKFDLAMEPPSPNELSGKRHLKTGGNIAGLFIHGPGRCGGDTFFVPRNPAMTAAAEDDGYLITFVHDRDTGKSEAVIIDAKTMGPEPVAVVELPGRVPIGFHAHFVTQEQLLQQAA